MTRRKKAALSVLVVLVGLVALAWNLGAIVEYAMTPSVTFADQPPPRAPDYTDDASWSALPERDDAGDAAPEGSPAIDQRTAPADVFYVHPTSYVGSNWNGPVDDPELNEATDRVATGIQATAFNACCAVYAPRYRQANGTVFYRPSADGERAFDLAYDDVRRAFAAFLARRGETRPFILAGHSQGAVLLERLLYEVIAGGPLETHLVVAYLPGGSITVAGLEEHRMRACETPSDVRCVAAWNARGPMYEPEAFLLIRPDTREKLCTNPLSWRLDGAHVSESANLGGAFLETPDHRVRPHFADAQCGRGTLTVRHLEFVPRDAPSRVLDHVLGEGNYHPVEYQLFFMNLRANAAERVTASIR